MLARELAITALSPLSLACETHLRAAGNRSFCDRITGQKGDKYSQSTELAHPERVAQPDSTLMKSLSTGLDPIPSNSRASEALSCILASDCRIRGT